MDIIKLETPLASRPPSLSSSGFPSKEHFEIFRLPKAGATQLVKPSQRLSEPHLWSLPSPSLSSDCNCNDSPYFPHCPHVTAMTPTTILACRRLNKAFHQNQCRNTQQGPRMPTPPKGQPCRNGFPVSLGLGLVCVCPYTLKSKIFFFFIWITNKCQVNEWMNNGLNKQTEGVQNERIVIRK